jgi:hypothetical protein
MVGYALVAMAVQPVSVVPRTSSGRYRAPVRARDELFAIWSVARAEANLAYDAWSAAPGRDTYLAYRAAEDRADAAQDVLAACARRAA